LNWRTGKLSNTNQLSAIYDTNSWKSFVSARLRLHVGDKEAITFHAGEHDLLLEHLTAEFPVQSESKHTGRVVDEWKERPGADNHWFDCLVGAAVAASIAGVVPASSESGARQRRKVEIPAGPDGKRVIVTKRAK
jgi:phage terminase large subunit GpA-like protein